MNQRIFFDEARVVEHWSQYPELISLFSKMEGAENWILDGDEKAMDMITRWVMSLDDKAIAGLNKHGESLLILLGFLSASKSFYLLNQLNTRSPSLLGHLASVATQSTQSPRLGRFSKVFIDRLRVSDGHRMINLLLNSEHLALVNHAIRTAVINKGGVL